MNFAVIVHQLGRLLLMLTAFLLGCAVFSFVPRARSNRNALARVGTTQRCYAFLTAAGVSGVLGVIAVFTDSQ